MVMVSLHSNRTVTTQLDSGQRVRDFGTFNAKLGVFIKFLSSGPKDIFRRGGKMAVRARGDGEHQGNCLPDKTR